MNILTEMFDTQTEMFCDPLNRSGRIKHGFSRYKEDEDFGVIWDAYRRLMGGSVQCNPMYPPEEILKALYVLRGAAADPQNPIFAICIIPEFRKGKYMELINGEEPMVGIHCLATIDKGYRFVPVEHWHGEPERGKGANFRVHLMCVYNARGLEKYYATARLQQGISKINDLVKLTGDWSHPPDIPEEGIRMRRSRTLPTEPPMALDRPGSTLREAGASQTTWPLPLALVDRDDIALRFDTHMTNLSYTDGSLFDDLAIPPGMGVYRPNAPEVSQTLMSRCEHTSNKRDINVTEMGATLLSVQHTLNDDEHSVALGDSLNCLYNMRKFLECPDAFIRHPNRDILVQWKREIVRRPNVTFWFGKIKGHRGFHGNDKADKGAKAACTADDESLVPLTLDYLSPPTKHANTASGPIYTRKGMNTHLEKPHGPRGRYS